MTEEEFEQTVRELRDRGLTDDNIMEILRICFEEKKMSLEDLKITTGWLGYELTDRFYEMEGITKEEDEDGAE